jgi:hypothetical protein
MIQFVENGEVRRAQSPFSPPLSMAGARRRSESTLCPRLPLDAAAPDD